MRKFIPFIVLLYFIVAAMYITYPLIWHLTDWVTGVGDELFIAWVLNWDIHAFTHNIFNIFNANIFYPYKNSLAFSDTFFTSALLAFIPTKLSGEPAVALNFTLLTTFIFDGFFTYVLVRYLTKNECAGIIAGTLVAFTTFTVSKTMHLQLITIYWIPLSILFFFKYIETNRFRNLIFCAIFFLLQTANSFLPGYFLVFTYTTFLTYFFFKKRKYFQKFFDRKVFVLCLLVTLCILPLVYPYFQVSQTFHYTRDIRDAIQFANRPEYTFYPPPFTRLHELLLTTIYRYDKGPFIYHGYLGLVLMALGAVALIYRYLILRKSPHKYFDPFVIVAIIGFILSLGPAWQWGGHVIKHPFIIPLPYAVAYYVIPGFQGMRNSARWEMLTVFAIAVIIGLRWAETFRHKKIFMQVFFTILICSAVLFEFKGPYDFIHIKTRKQFPEAYTYLNTLSDNATIAILPLYNWDMLPYSYREQFRVYMSTAYFRNIMNGTSGFTPPPREKDAHMLMLEFPEKETVNFLKKSGVQYILLDEEEYKLLNKNNLIVDKKPIPKWETIIKSVSLNKEFILVKKFDGAYLYKIKTIKN